jgi:hypothetical protein
LFLRLLADDVKVVAMLFSGSCGVAQAGRSSWPAWPAFMSEAVMVLLTIMAFGAGNELMQQIRLAMFPESVVAVVM